MALCQAEAKEGENIPLVCNAVALVYGFIPKVWIERMAFFAKIMAFFWKIMPFSYKIMPLFLRIMALFLTEAKEEKRG